MKLHSLPYPAYEESDTEWISYLPEEWTEKRVKDLFRLVTDLAPKDNDFELLSLYTSIGVKPRKEMEQRGNKSVTTEDYWIVKKGDIIVNKLLAWMGAIGLSEYDGVTSPAYDILRRKRKNKREVDERFYTYLFRTERAQQIFKKYSRGIMDVRLRLYFDKLGAISIPVPPFATQKAIADYLDVKTAQIDRKINLLAQKAEKYAELKQSLINETVIRGLNKTALMTDSGVEWIGKIPAHWVLNRHKDNFLFITDRAVDNKLNKVGLENIEGKTGRFVNTETDFDGNGIQFKEHDVLFGKLRPYLAKVYLAEFSGNAIGDIFVYRPKHHVIPKFAQYLMLSNRYIDVINSSTAGAKMPRVDSNFIANLPVAMPPLSEQKAIVEFLNTKTAQIDRIIETINTEIKKFNELRKALINDVVMGKIKVYET